jgi:hypothetical protein
MKSFIAIWLVVVVAIGAWSTVFSADLLSKSPGGWLFDYKGVVVQCRSEGGGIVTCRDVKGNDYVCEYREPENGYFANCRKSVGI